MAQTQRLIVKTVARVLVLRLFSFSVALVRIIYLTARNQRHNVYIAASVVSAAIKAFILYETEDMCVHHDIHYTHGAKLFHGTIILLS